MKNVQVIDGAVNSTFEIYEVPDDLFALMFPNGNDVAFLDDVERTFRGQPPERSWDIVYGNRVDKKHVAGIDGTLHLTGSPCRSEYFPTRKEAEVSTTPKR